MEEMYSYEAPVVEIIEVEVEKGFNASLGDSDGGATGEGMGGLN